MTRSSTMFAVLGVLMIGSMPAADAQVRIGTVTAVSGEVIREITDSSGTSTPTGPLPVVGGAVEPDYKYPWVVQENGCAGVLIHPRWVLTAAHCVDGLVGTKEVSYQRTDPYTGAVVEGGADSVGPGPSDGVFPHPIYNRLTYENDIALIKLKQPFALTPYLQTVALPTTPRPEGVVGTVAKALPEGQVGIFRAPIPGGEGAEFSIDTDSTNPPASLCPGDSGSGLVTVENGRAIVRGIVSSGTITDCMTPYGFSWFTDVFTYHDWILQTMHMTDDASLAGNTRVRWSGFAARGVMGVECITPTPPSSAEGPLNVVGVEEGAVCAPRLSQTLSCRLNPDQGNVGSLVPKLDRVTVRTTMADGTSVVRSFLASSNSFSYHTTFPPNAVSREFTCQVGAFKTILPSVGVNSAPLSIQRGS